MENPRPVLYKKEFIKIENGIGVGFWEREWHLRPRPAAWTYVDITQQK